MNNEKIYVFQHSTLLRALEDWKQAQLAAYPHRRELIETVTLAMLDFLDSEQARRHKMLVSTGPEPAQRKA